MTLFVFLAGFVLYLATLAPSITVGDSGELCAAGTILGVAHSPGYPLYALIAKAFTVLFPLGSHAFRVNLVSAVFGAAAVALLYRAVLAYSEEGAGARDAGSAPYGASLFSGAGRKLALAVPALAVGVMPAFWRSAIQAEVFTLNAFFAALLLYAVMKRKDCLAFFGFGLGLGNHQTLVFLGPLAVYSAVRNGMLTLQRGAILALCFVVGFSVYLYLPVRAMKGPALNWGNPRTPHAFWRVLTRADYGTTSLTTGEKLPRTAANTLRQAGRMARDLKRQVTAAGLLLVGIGFYAGIRRKYPLSKALFATWLFAGPAFLFLANLPFNAESDGILERFYILTGVFLAFPLAVCVDYALEKTGRPLAAGAAGLAVLGILAAVRFGDISWRQYYLAYDYGRNILRTLAPGSVLFMDGGDDTFYSTAYLCFAEGRRQDLELHDRGGLVFKSVYGPDFRQLTRDEKEARRQAIERTYAGRKPLYYATFNRTILPGIAFEPDGFLYRQERPDKRDAWPCYSLRGVYDGDHRDYRSAALVPVYPYFAGLREKKMPPAVWDYALNRWPQALWLKGNLGVEMAQEAYRRYRVGDREGARQAYLRLHAWNDRDVSAILNIGVIEKELHRTDKALEWYRKALELDPRYGDAYYNIAVIYWEQGDFERAAGNLRRLLEIDPEDARARRFLPLALEKIRR